MATKRTKPLTPLAIIKPPKPIGAMTDAERRAFAAQLADAISEARKPASNKSAPETERA